MLETITIEKLCRSVDIFRNAQTLRQYAGMGNIRFQRQKVTFFRQKAKSLISDGI